MQKPLTVEVVRCMSQWSMSQWLKLWLRKNQWVNGSPSKWVNESMNQWIGESMIQWIIESLNQTTKKHQGRLNQWISEFCQPLATVCCTFLPTSSSKVLQALFLTCFFVKPSSRYSLVHILPNWSSKSARNASVVWHIEMQMELLELAIYIPVHILSTTFPNRGPHPRKQSPNCYSSLLLPHANCSC